MDNNKEHAKISPVDLLIFPADNYIFNIPEA